MEASSTAPRGFVAMMQLLRARSQTLLAGSTLAIIAFCSAVAHAQDAVPAAPPADQTAADPGRFQQALAALEALRFADIEAWRWLAAGLLLLVGFFVRAYLLDKILSPIRQFLSKTETDLDDQLLEHTERPLRWVGFVIILFFAIEVLGLPKRLSDVLISLLQTGGTAGVAWALYASVEVLTTALSRYTQGTDGKEDDHVVPLVTRALRITVVMLAVIAVLQQWGYDATSLIAGLGIGGLAFAMAAKDMLANWFGAVMIFTDQPFKMGDWVQAGSAEGTVEDVGFRSTQIRTIEGTLMTIPNASIATATIENFSARPQRRINATIGLTYDASQAQLEQIIESIRAMLHAHANIDDETINVFFTGFGESTLDIVVLAFSTTPAWGEYMEIRQDVFFRIMKIVEVAGAEFAFPSRTLYIDPSSAAPNHLVRPD